MLIWQCGEYTIKYTYNLLLCEASGTIPGRLGGTFTRMGKAHMREGGRERMGNRRLGRARESLKCQIHFQVNLLGVS